MTGRSLPRRTAIVSTTLLALSLASPTFAQSPSPGDAPGPTSDIIGPEGSFRLRPDGETWVRLQNARAIGVGCTEKACGADRVFCLLQVRGDKDARAGRAVSAEKAVQFGDGVVKRAPEGARPEYVSPFAEARFGGNVGQFAEVKSDRERGALRFGWFMAEADAHLVVLNCVTPAAKWDAYRPSVEKLIASLEITKSRGRTERP